MHPIWSSRLQEDLTAFKKQCQHLSVLQVTGGTYTVGVFWYFHGLPDTLPDEEFATRTGTASASGEVAEVDAIGDCVSDIVAMY